MLNSIHKFHSHFRIKLELLSTLSKDFYSLAIIHS